MFMCVHGTKEIIDELDRKPGLCPLEGRPAKILVVVEDYLLSPFPIRFNMMFDVLFVLIPSSSRVATLGGRE